MEEAFIFPGQGSQYAGMGRDLCSYFPEAEAVFDQADEALGFELKKLCFNGPEAELKKTINTQPAVLTTSVACMRMLFKRDCRPQAVAGHSLGEYTALVAAGVLTFPEALQLVRKRGYYMQEAVPEGEGGMVAVLGLEEKKVEKACREARSKGFVAPANYNCPGQIVISGEEEALIKAAELCNGYGAKRTVKLAVSAPFHSRLMEPVRSKLAEEIAGLTFRPPQMPVVTNIDARLKEDPEKLKEALISQVASPVLWEQSMHTLIGEGCRHFVEVGPRKVLNGFLRRIDRSIEVFNVEDAETLDVVTAL